MSREELLENVVAVAVTLMIVAAFVLLFLHYARRPAPIPPEPDDPSLGLRNATSTLIVYGDYECRACLEFYREILPQLSGAIDAGELRVVLRNYPLESHPVAQRAADAAECAHTLGTFWDLHAKLLAAPNLTRADVDAASAALGLDEACILDANQAVRQDLYIGEGQGVTFIPTYFLNGQRLAGNDALKAAIGAS